MNYHFEWKDYDRDSAINTAKVLFADREWSITFDGQGEVVEIFSYGQGNHESYIEPQDAIMFFVKHERIIYNLEKLISDLELNYSTGEFLKEGY